jgi:hypothetical protein
LILKNIQFFGGTRTSFLSTKEDLSWKQDGNDVEISLPAYNPNKIKSPYAFTVKIENYGNYVSKPRVNVTYKPGELKPWVTMSTVRDANMYYTTDGSEPTRNSLHYNSPFVPDKPMIIKVIAYPLSESPTVRRIPSAVAVQEIKVYAWKKALNLWGAKPGIAYNYIEPTGKIDMGSINNKVTSTGIAQKISHEKKKRTDRFAFEFWGFIKIEKDGIYTFFTESDDGSKLFIDDEEVVNNDGDHGTVEKSGKAALKKGFHKIRVLYFDSGGGNVLKVLMQREGEKKEEISADILYH